MRRRFLMLAVIVRRRGWSAPCTSTGRVPEPGEMLMFSLKIIDHVRLDSERVAQNYTVHAAAAERAVRVIRVFRIGIAALLALAASMEIANTIFPRSLYPGAAVGAGMAALVAFTIY